jgi:N-acetylmuramoyl-L-alanine amidase
MSIRPINARFNLSILSTLLIALAAATLGGCQSEGMDQDLPPLRLSGPVIAQPSALAVPAAAYIPDGPLIPHAVIPYRVLGSDPERNGVPAAWIPAVRANRWIWIIVHHSDSTYGSAAVIDRWHRQRGFDELGYDFVIGNGTNSGDGQIEVGPRWTKQKWGAHDNALDNRFNISGIGICLVGDFNHQHPTTAQRRSLMRLCFYLMKTYHITPGRVLGHGETKDTQCPGRYLRVSEIRASLAEMLAQNRSAAYVADGR